MTAPRDWYEANQRCLALELERVRAALTGDESGQPGEEAASIREGMAWPPAVDLLASRFALSSFERDVVLMCAGPELDGEFASKVGPTTFSLALARLDGAHWSALTPSSPLRRWRLLDLDAERPVTAARLRIDERILHFLAGVQNMDERLGAVVEAFPAVDGEAESHRRLAETIVDTLRRAAEHESLPTLQLLGTDAGGKRAVAAEVARRLEVDLMLLPAAEIPAGGHELHDFIRLWQREVLLAGSGLYVDLDRHEEPAGSAGEIAILRLADGLSGLLVIASPHRLRGRYRSFLGFDVPQPEPPEQRRLWTDLLGPRSEQLDHEVRDVSVQFRLGLDALHAARSEVAGLLSDNGSRDLGQALWDACRRQARPRLEDLAQRIEPRATRDDLVLPEAQLDVLRQIAVHVRQRHRVHESWKLGSRCSRGLGISALFAGGSGTGKTTAAEVLAHELRLDVYRVDLSSVVSKYIGETEKNLRRIFDAAEEGGVILLFDEADALFGKRSEVKDSHDRYANIEVSYLLQRMESYQGLAILTTNKKSALDPAFLRRLRFVVEFPFPDAGARQRIWRGMFPSETPTERLDLGKLARLNVAGGNIRNIALDAAFCAADEPAPVRMEHLLVAAKREYRKLEKPLNESEIRGWV